MSLGLSGCSEENTLQPKREKGGARMPRQQVRAKAFCFMSPRDRIERYTFLYGVFFPPPLFMHLQLTWLCQCLLKLVITTSPHCSDTSDESNTELTRGAAADSWNWLWLLCHCELYRSGFATLKGENGSTLEESTVLCPSPSGRKGRLGVVLTKFSYGAFCVLTSPLPWGRLFTLGISVLETKREVSYDIKIAFLQGTRYL